jgi:hypothetical protein
MACEFIALRPRRENGMIVRESDWLRITRMVEEMTLYRSAYQAAASMSAGALVSFSCLWFSLVMSATPIPCWAWAADITVIFCSGLASAMCFMFDSRLKIRAVCDVRSVLRELKDIRAQSDSSK